jgi:hypothetical protein
MPGFSRSLKTLYTFTLATSKLSSSYSRPKAAGLWLFKALLKDRFILVSMLGFHGDNLAIGNLQPG